MQSLQVNSFQGTLVSFDIQSICCGFVCHVNLGPFVAKFLSLLTEKFFFHLDGLYVDITFVYSFL